MSKSSNKPTFGITLGDPMGIGPEIAVKALKSRAVRDLAEFSILGDSRFRWNYEDLPKQSAAKQNKIKTEAGLLSWAALNQGLHLAKQNKIQALITAPVSKTHLNLARFPYPGQTEYIASFWPKHKASMMLSCSKLRVILVTIHKPLRDIFTLITAENILEKITLAEHSLKKDLGIKKPRIAVCGLNPHAGENGLLGDEEQKIILPAIKKAIKKGINVTGPHPPDTVFYWASKGHYDAVVCQYHDQGLIPLKTIGMDEGVNTTLGLPLIRTSPDHGTAFDIAGQNRADPNSMIEAILLAHKIWLHRKK